MIPIPQPIPRPTPASPMDDRLDEVLAVINRQMCEAGLFHCELEFDRASLACRYAHAPLARRRYSVRELLAAPHAAHASPFPSHARVRPDEVAELLARLAPLCYGERPLAAASLNLLTGRVVLRFPDERLHLSTREWLAACRS